MCFNFLVPSLSFVLSPFLVSQRQFSTLLGNKDLFCSVPFIKDRDPRAGADRGGPAGSLERRSAHGRRAPEVPEGVRAAGPAQVRPDAEALSHRPGFSSSERCDIRKVCREKNDVLSQLLHAWKTRQAQRAKPTPSWCRC